MVMVETHVLKVVGSNHSTEYWMDIFVVNIVMFKKAKINEKEAGDGPFKKGSSLLT